MVELGLSSRDAVAMASDIEDLTATLDVTDDGDDLSIKRASRRSRSASPPGKRISLTV